MNTVNPPMHGHNPKPATAAADPTPQPVLTPPPAAEPESGEKNAEACSFEGCEKPVRSKGLCQGHYHQKHKGKELTPLREQRGGRKAKPKTQKAPRKSKIDTIAWHNEDWRRFFIQRLDDAAMTFPWIEAVKVATRATNQTIESGMQRMKSVKFPETE